MTNDGPDAAAGAGTGTSVVAIGECMTAAGQHRRERIRSHRAHPVRRQVAWSAAAMTAIAALFQPLPASAAPIPPAPPAGPAVPDSGARPVAAPTAPAAGAQPVAAAAVPDAGARPVAGGAFLLPGQTTPVSAPAASSGLALSPVLAQAERMRADVALLGERLLALAGERDAARQQVLVAERKLTEARAAVLAAERRATTAASSALMQAAALPPGAATSELQGLGALARLQRGEPADERAAARQVLIARAAEHTAIADHRDSVARADELAAQYDRLAAEHQVQQAALQKFELDNAAEIAAGEAAQQAQDLQTGAVLGTGQAGVGTVADPRAVAALSYALAQRGDPYVWAAEGPDTFDCSGLMWAAYRTPAAGSYTLPRVSRDQYWATRAKPVDRNALLPGDLLFFSSSSSWTGIHHVAMFAGDGMMVEAPRSGLNVRLTPVRWARLFQATRVYGPVTGTSPALPSLGQPDPDPTTTTRPTPSPTKSATPSPSPSTSPRPTTPPPTTTPPTTPPTTTPPTTTPPTTPPTSSPPTTPPTTSPPPPPPSTPPSTPPSSSPSPSPSESASPSAPASPSGQGSSEAGLPSPSASSSAPVGTQSEVPATAGTPEVATSVP